MKSLSAFCVAVVLLLTAVAPAAAQGAKADQTKRLKATGKVTVINRYTRRVTIETKEIPGLEGKTMPVQYLARDTVALAKLHEGDQVVGDLVVSGLDTYMENVKPAKEADKTKKESNN